MDKKKVVIHSAFCKTNTGFGRHKKEILKYLYNTGKYELIEYATGLRWSDDSLTTLPWKAYGTLPDSKGEFDSLVHGMNPQNRAMKERQINYGIHNIDKLIKEEKPDVYIGIEDIWAFNGFFNKPWWNKINCVIHTTLDSLPILPEAVTAAEDVKHYYVWADFARKALHELGHKHVKTLHGAIDTKVFYKLPSDQRLKLRKRYNISENAFIGGFVFRNQSRKSVIPLLKGFKKFCNKNPNVDAYLLLHTSWSEGWNIAQRMKEIGVEPSRILTTYVCKNCGEYEIKPFQLTKQQWQKSNINRFEGEKQDCQVCNSKSSQSTTSTNVGVSEKQLNEIYNLMDVYVHPFNSGGQELPIIESKLTGLISLVTNYSCGTEYFTEDTGSLPLDWSEYRETGTEFIKASTHDSSICKQLDKVYNMNPKTREKMSKKAREWALKEFSVESIGKKYEEIIDSMPKVEWNFEFEESFKNTNYKPKDIENNKEWLKDLYINILGIEVREFDDNLLNWESALENNKCTRNDVYKSFIKEAEKYNRKKKHTKTIKALFEGNDNKKGLIVIKESLGDCFILTSLFKSFKEQYPNHNLYVATQPRYFDVFLGNPYIDKLIPYHEVMENELHMIGHGTVKGFVDVYIYPTIGVQRHLNYLSHDKIALELEK